MAQEKGTSITIKGIPDDVMLALTKKQLELKEAGSRKSKADLIKDILEDFSKK